MRFIYVFHNSILLKLIQEWFFACWPASILVMLVLLVCLPEHRRAARVVAGMAAAWALVCLLAYGAFVESPVLAVSLILMLAYRFCRWFYWRLPPGVESSVKRPMWQLFQPRAAWVSWIVRDYIWADPRATYWLDTARSVRGLPLTRSRLQRSQMRLPLPCLPAWRQRVWQLFFRIIEWRIALYQWLPTYWKRPHARLELGEPHLQWVLEQESRHAYREMLCQWAGRDFNEYCGRDPLAQKVASAAAARYGRAYCLMREALVEYLAFRTPWKKGESGLVTAGATAYHLWQQRRRFDMLWYADDDVAALKHRDTVPGDVEPVTAAGGDRDLSDGSAATESDVLDLTDGAADPARNGDAPGSESDASPVPKSFVPSDSGDRDPMVSAGHVELARADEMGGEAMLRNTSGAAPVAEEPQEEDEAMAVVTVAEVETSPHEARSARDRAAGDIPDVEMFQVAQDASESDERSHKACSASEELVQVNLQSRRHRDDERSADLYHAVALLEAYLGFRGTSEFDRDVRQAERLLGGRQTAEAALLLLMIYCLRRDFKGDRVSHDKIDLLIRLDQRFGVNDTGDPQWRKLRRRFQDMRLDVLMEWGEYTQVREYLGQRDDLSHAQWKILADAEAALAKHLVGQTELRDMLRYDAVCHYFLARFCGVWTLEYARVLIDGIETVDQLVALLRKHSVTVARPQPMTLGEEAVKTRRAGRVQQSPKTRRPPIAKIQLAVYWAANPHRRAKKIVPKVPYTIGRSQEADWTIPSDRLAPLHFRISEHAKGLTITDLTKSKSLKINGGKPANTAAVKQGDRVQLAGLVIEIERVLRATG